MTCANRRRPWLIDRQLGSALSAEVSAPIGCIRHYQYNSHACGGSHFNSQRRHFGADFKIRIWRFFNRLLGEEFCCSPQASWLASMHLLSFGTFLLLPTSVFTAVLLR